MYWRQNAIVFKNRDKLLNHLVSNGVYARKYFPSLSELFPFIKKDNLSKYYMLNLQSGDLVWSKNNSAPFNSQIKIFKNK